MKNPIVLLCIAITVFSCNKKQDIKTKDSNVDTLMVDVSEGEENIEDLTLKQLTFPKTGKSIEDFVLDPCEIKMQTEGFLNNDNFKDAVIVLKNQNDNTDLRATLVLLGEKNGRYKLGELSWEAVGPEYLEDGYQRYDSEELSIDEEKKLHITLSGGGPTGTRETIYKYVNDKLVLVNINTFHSGAGSWLSSSFNLVSGEVDHEVTNTLHDSIPSEHQIKKFKLDEEILFVKHNPDSILEKLPQADW